MKHLAVLVLLLTAHQLFAQQDSVAIKRTRSEKMLSLSRADIERLPVMNFMELVQGAFPFVESDAAWEENYSFVVNGFVAINPNAINISQIENITFYPAGTELTRGSQAKMGTFVINTIPTAGKKFSVSSKTGELIAQNLGGNAIKFGKGFFSLDEVSYSNSGAKGYFSSSFSYFRNQQPGFLGTYPYDLSSEGYNERFRISNFGSYNLSKKLQVDGGLFFTYQPSSESTSSSSTFPITYRNTVNDDAHVNYWAGAIALKYTPSIRVSNILRGEANYYPVAHDQILAQSASSNFDTTVTDNTNKYKIFAFTDQFIWHAATSGNLQIDASLVARYETRKEEYLATVIHFVNGTPFQAAMFSGAVNDRSVAVSPDISVNWKHIIYATAGATWDNYNTSMFQKDNHVKLLPDAELKIDITPMLRGSMSTLVFSSAYDQMKTAYGLYDRLGTPFRIFSPGMIISSNLTGDYDPGSNWVSYVSASWHKLALKLSYVYQDRTIEATVPAPGGANNTYYTIVFTPLKRSAIGFEASAVLIDNGENKWDLLATVTRDHYTQTQYSNGFTPQPYQTVVMDAGKDPWRCGIKSSVTLHRFFAQVSMLLDFNEVGTSSFDDTMYRSNFLLAGYRFQFKSSKIKQLALNVQTRDLLQSANSRWLQYAGVGLQADF